METQLEPASVTVKNFLDFLAANGWEYKIHGVYRDKVRHGYIQVKVKGLEIGLDFETFERATWRWDAADTTIGTVRTGSPKHLAIKALYERLAERIGYHVPGYLTPEQELTLAEHFS